MKILLDVSHKDENLFLQKFCNENEIILVSNLKFNKFKNVSIISDLNKLHEYNIDVFIISNIKNKKHYENYINSNTNKYYVFSSYDLVISNPNCDYHRTIKMHKIFDIVLNLCTSKYVTPVTKEINYTEIAKRTEAKRTEAKRTEEKRTEVNNYITLPLEEKNEFLYKPLVRNSVFDNLPIYCINLKHSIERNKFIKLQTNNKYNIKFIEAVYGKDIPHIESSNYLKRSKKYNLNNAISLNELGCLFSHIKVFEESKNDDYIIVIEDDINLISFMNEYVASEISKIISKNVIECLQLCIIVNENIHLPEISNFTLVDWNFYNKQNKFGCFWSTGAYIISKQAREHLIHLFYSNIILNPADFFIYSNVSTKTLLPPIILPNHELESTIQNDVYSLEYKSNKTLNIKYNINKKLILIAIWFGELPFYLDLWFASVNKKNFDVLFITDQNINKKPDNLKIINMSLHEFNNLIKTKTNFNVNITNAYKIVDAKPLLGYLFSEFICLYDFWGWSDIDIIFGNLNKDLDDSHDIISYGFKSFGPIMIFKINELTFFKKIENYEKILNDKFVCKVDEPWFFHKFNSKNDGDIFNDEGTYVKFYSGNNLLDAFQGKNIKIVPWSKFCININWDIKSKINKNNYFEEITSYNLNSLNLTKNNNVISFCHLTQLKTCNVFKKTVKTFNYHCPELKFTIKHTFNPPCEESINLNYNVVECYEKYIKTTIDCEKQTSLDFVTIFFNDEIEIFLLKLQAYSFKMVDINLINNIILFYQDLCDINFNDIIMSYPENYRSKVKIIKYKDTQLNSHYLKNPWQLQQLNKLLISKYVTSNFYCVLDSKNHFINKVNHYDFFKNDKYYIFTSNGCRDYYDFYYAHCGKYFTGEKTQNINNISMSTPFIFDTVATLSLINFVEIKETKCFDLFFMENSAITEFYFYSNYVNFKKYNNFEYKEIIHTSIHSTWNEDWSLKFIDNKLYENTSWKLFGIHRKAIKNIDIDYKHKLLNMYDELYNDDILNQKMRILFEL